MSAEELKAIARRYIEEVWNKGNLALIDEWFTPDHINHSPNVDQTAGPEGLKQFITSSAIKMIEFKNLAFTYPKATRPTLRYDGRR